jgi:hypothetical protein
MTYEDLCRQALHNKVEREVIELELALNDDISFPRSQYLGSGLERLNKEKDFLVRKEERIRKFNTMNYSFII